MIINDFFSSILFASSFLILGIAYFSIKNKKSYIFYCLLAVAIYSIAYGFEIMYASIPWILFWLRIEYIGIVFLPMAWINFVFHYTGRKQMLTKRLLRGMTFISILILIFMYTNPYHHMFYRKIYIDTTSLYPMVGVIKGPLYWINEIYTYLSMGIGFVYMLNFYKKSIQPIKRQVFLVTIAWMLPWFADIIYILKILPFHGDLSPFAFSLSGIISSMAIVYQNFIRLTPIGMEQVFYHMSDGALILDQKDHIVNYNPSAQKIITFLQNNYQKGQLNYSWLQHAIKKYEVESGLLKIKEDNQREQYFKLKHSDIIQQDHLIGRIILFSDVTRLEIERQSKEKEYRFLQTLMDTLKNPIYSKNQAGEYLQCNLAFCNYFGRSKQEIIGKTDFDFMDHKTASKLAQKDANLRKKQKHQMFEIKLKHKDGTWHDVSMNQSLLFEKDHKFNITGSVGVIVDITTKKKKQIKMDKLMTLKESMLKIGYELNEVVQMKDLLLYILKEVIACIDEANGGCVFILEEDKNLTIAAQIGFDEESATNFSVTLEDYLKGINKEEAMEKTVLCNDCSGIDILLTKKKEIKTVLLTPILLGGELHGFFAINSIKEHAYGAFEVEIMEYMKHQLASVISKHKKYEQTLYLSRYDHLTNIFNRSYFERVFEEILQNKQKDSFYFVLFDLNDLKQVNDLYGHLAGDTIISYLATGLQLGLEEQDFLGRYGGDEFVGVFFRNTKEALIEEFEVLSNKFKKNPIHLGNAKIVCGFSYGFAQFPEEGMTFKELVKIADERMYELKREKKQ